MLADYFVNSVGQFAWKLNEADATPFIWSITRICTPTQSRRPCRDVQLDEAVLLKNPVSPCLIHKIIG